MHYTVGPASNGNENFDTCRVQFSEWNQFKIEVIGDKIALCINNVNCGDSSNENRQNFLEIKVHVSDTFHRRSNSKIRGLKFC